MCVSKYGYFVLIRVVFSAFSTYYYDILIIFAVKENIETLSRLAKNEDYSNFISST